MLSFLSSLFTGGIGKAAQGISRGVATFTGDKVQQEANTHTEAMAVHQAYASENAQLRENRTWWDALWDGINRAPRPIMALGVIGLFVWPIFDPVGFAAAMQAYALVPEWVAYIFLAVVGFYFTARHLEKVRIGKGPSVEDVKAVLDTQKQIRAMREEPAMEDEEFQAAMADTSKPLGNKAIMEWNKRHSSR